MFPTQLLHWPDWPDEPGNAGGGAVQSRPSAGCSEGKHIGPSPFLWDGWLWAHISGTMSIWRGGQKLWVFVGILVIEVVVDIRGPGTGLCSGGTT